MSFEVVLATVLQRLVKIKAFQFKTWISRIQLLKWGEHLLKCTLLCYLLSNAARYSSHYCLLAMIEMKRKALE